MTHEHEPGLPSEKPNRIGMTLNFPFTRKHLRTTTILLASAIVASLLIAAPIMAQAAATERVNAAASASAAAIERTAVTDRTSERVHFAAVRTENQNRAAAAATVARVKGVIAATASKVDPAPLVASVAALSTATLSASSLLDSAQMEGLTKRAERQIVTAEAKAAAVDAAAAAVVAALAERLRVANTPAGARATARRMAASQYGWGSAQFGCLSRLWQKESGWSYEANNASGGAHGIPQALPGRKMASAGPDWRTNAATQIRWGLSYIKRSYGSPCGAWAHSVAHNWY